MRKLTLRWAIYLRIAGFCGMISPFLVFTLVAVSIHYCPSFSWTQSYLSLLGVEGSSRTLFNASLIAGGVLDIAFAIGFGKSLPSRKLLGRLGILCLILGACSMCAVGIFPRTMYAPHDYASVAFFSFIPMSLFLIGAVQLTSSRRASGLFTFICGVLMVVLQLIPWPWSGEAIPQVLACIPWSVWLIAFGTKLFIAPK